MDPKKHTALATASTEMPGHHHAVSANASEAESARLLAVFVVNTDEKNLTTPDRKRNQ